MSNAAALSPIELAALRRLVRQHGGVSGAAKVTGLTRHAITSLLAETEVHRGTVLHARECLAPFAAESAA